MIYWFSLLGFGDALISASMFEKLGKTESVRLIGTKATCLVSQLIQDKTNIYPLMKDTPWVFNIKQRCPFSYGSDFYKMRKFIASSTNTQDILFYEHPSRWRTLLLCGPTNRAMFNIRRANNAYIDRASAIQPYLGNICWPPAPRLYAPVRSLFINPSARFKDRVIPNEAVRFILEKANKARIVTTLVDVSGQYGNLKSTADNYVPHPKLRDSAAQLKNSSFYIGPDSFFSHLAYYYGIPQMGIYKRSNLYFCPPGLLQNGGVFYFENINNRLELESKLANIFRQ